MKLRLIALLILLPASLLAASNYYKLQNVKRVNSNLYSASSGATRVLIETQFCFEMVVGVDAVLKYQANSYDNKIIFNDDNSCDVVKVVAQ